MKKIKITPDVNVLYNEKTEKKYTKQTVAFFYCDLGIWREKNVTKQRAMSGGHKKAIYHVVSLDKTKKKYKNKLKTKNYKNQKNC